LYRFDKYLVVTMDYLPIFLNIKGQPCLVVGGGSVAARKVRLLLQAGGSVSVVAPALGPELAKLAAENVIQHIEREFEAQDLRERALVIAATDALDINSRVSELAKRQRIPVNVVDQPDLCGFITPSIIDRSPVQVAISTGGASPVLARLLRTHLESYIPSAYGRLALLVDEFRGQVKRQFTNVTQRRYFWERVLQGSVAELLFAGREDAARKALEKAVNEAEEIPEVAGEVYLVGAGPGDPDLLTFRALRLMQQADVVVYDRLVAPAILELVRRDADHIYAGKERDNHAIPQENINELLIRLAKQGKRVLRLKGGDPFIFGRGGEEIATLMEEGIHFQVVPGITAAAGCAAYAGIPLTHRDYAQACVFVTGHLQDGTVNLNWEMLSQPRQTVVIYMGLYGIDVVCRELIAHGLSKTTPVALIQQGTTPQQRTFLASLKDLPSVVHEHDVKAPTLIIVGDVVRLHEKLRWFEGDEIDVLG